MGTFASWASDAGILGIGLFRRALESEQTPVETQVAQLESAAYEEVRRIWEHMKGKEEKLQEFAERLMSQEAQTASLSAIVHCLRTADPVRRTRLAVILIHCIYQDKLQPESLDDMMRAAVELREIDVHLLQAICQTWELQSTEARESGFAFEEITAMWKQLEQRRVAFTLSTMGALTRLQAHGLIHSLYGGGYGSATRYYLLKEGYDFCELLREPELEAKETH